MKQWIQTFWLKRHLKKLAPDVNRVQTPIKEIKRIGVLSSDVPTEVQQELITQLKSHFNGSATLVYIYFVKQKSAAAMEPFEISASDFSLTGSLEHPALATALEQPFDLVVHYHESNNPFVSWLGFQMKAPIRVGFKAVSQNISNLILDVPITAVDLFVKELNKYINILKEN